MRKSCKLYNTVLFKARADITTLTVDIYWSVLVPARDCYNKPHCWPYDDALNVGVLCYSGDDHGFALIVSDGDAHYLVVVTIAVVYIAVAFFGLVELAVAVDERQRAVEQIFFCDGLP